MLLTRLRGVFVRLNRIRGQGRGSARHPRRIQSAKARYTVNGVRRRRPRTETVTPVGIPAQTAERRFRPALRASAYRSQPPHHPVSNMENSMATYTNPWHRPRQPMYGPAKFDTDAKPVEYRGHLIYQRLPQCFDVVRDGGCIAQRAGIRGARAAVDARLGV